MAAKLNRDVVEEGGCDVNEHPVHPEGQSVFAGCRGAAGRVGDDLLQVGQFERPDGNTQALCVLIQQKRSYPFGLRPVCSGALVTEERGPEALNDLKNSLRLGRGVRIPNGPNITNTAFRRGENAPDGTVHVVSGGRETVPLQNILLLLRGAVHAEIRVNMLA